MQLWTNAIGRILERMEDTREKVGTTYPHWCDPDTGKWTTTVEGDWTGGYWPGMHWLAAKYTGEDRYRAQALALTEGLKNRVSVESVFKSFPFYFGGVLGAVLFHDKRAQEFALAGARSLVPMYNSTLKLIPLGAQAEEGDNISNVESSIDSLHAASLLLWAAQASGDEEMRQIGRQHAASVIPLHRRKDDSYIQSSTLDPSGKLVRHHTHKGYSDSSTWARAQVWGTLFSVMAYLQAPEETSWLEAAQSGADWWIAHVPKDHVAFWDFDDPAIPNTERDTAATVAASSALLKLAKLANDTAARSRYQAAAEATIEALVTKYLTPTSPTDKRIPGILTESCFNKRPDSRPHDAANKCEFILSDYYLLECLLVLTGKLDPTVI